ncbi:MAG: alcohol dehydrogenase catalytic domain-containing protein [Candidatus Lokiarchaeota archaeon]|nr:alcohol dehydrogenase catalytic domain-containing protein [Candidatus Lokiarchaeota archaeon]
MEIIQSLILTDDGLHLADVPIPSLLPGEIKIEVRYVGLCGTDVSIWKGDHNVNLPLVLGHEFTGVIHQSTIPQFKVGSLVTAETAISCGSCWYCTNNMTRHCKKRETLGITTDGALSEFLTVPSEIVHVLPPDIDSVSGTFVEPIASAIQTRIKTPVDDGEPMVIIGCGKLGLIIAQVYDAVGAEVYLLDKNPWKLGLAKQLGFRRTIDVTTADWSSAILDETYGVGPRVVVEATGTAKGLDMALDIVRNNGVIALKSKHSDRSSIDPSQLAAREVQLQGSADGPFDIAIDMLNKGRIEVKRLVTKHFPLEDSQKAFEYAAKPDVNKVIIGI